MKRIRPILLALVIPMLFTACGGEKFGVSDQCDGTAEIPPEIVPHSSSYSPFAPFILTLDRTAGTPVSGIVDLDVNRNQHGWCAYPYQGTTTPEVRENYSELRVSFAPHSLPPVTYPANLATDPIKASITADASLADGDYALTIVTHESLSRFYVPQPQILVKVRTLP